MSHSLNRSRTPLVAGVVLGLVLTVPTFAQNPPARKPMADDPPPAVIPYPAGGLNPAAQGALINNRVAPAPVVGSGSATNVLPNVGGTFSSTPTPNTPPYNPNRAFNASVVYPGWDPWGGTYYPSPYFPFMDPWGGFMRGSRGMDDYGFMRGAADIISASGSYAVRVQESRMIGQQVEQARIDTRRKIFDQWLYERANTPTNQDERERIQRLELRRALTDPPPSEIMNADPLNRILLELKGKNSLPRQGAVIDESTLRQINVRPPKTAGNVGVLRPLKEGAQMNWPPLLKSEPYQKEVKIINTRAAEAVKQAIHNGEVDPSILKELSSAINDLKKRLDDGVADLTAAEWIESKRFLAQVDDARRALGTPAAANFFTDKFIAKGKTVPELIDYMRSKGLEFAPAVTGDEASYMALYNYLQAYTNSLGSAPLQPADQ